LGACGIGCETNRYAPGHIVLIWQFWRDIELRGDPVTLGTDQGIREGY
jgi:hypothetical protein